MSASSPDQSDFACRSRIRVRPDIQPPSRSTRHPETDAVVVGLGATCRWARPYGRTWLAASSVGSLDGGTVDPHVAGPHVARRGGVEVRHRSVEPALGVDLTAEGVVGEGDVVTAVG